MAPNPHFVLTDGDTSVDLLSSQGFLLRSWSPSALNIRGGGVRNESALSDGSVPVLSRRDNVIDQLTICARHISEDDLYEEIQDLLRLLERAVEYWTSSWSTPPVWLELRGPNETNTRYAAVVMYSLPGISSPFEQTIFTCLQNPATTITLTLEHLPWQNAALGTDVCVQASGTQQGELIYSGSYSPAHNDDDVHVNVALGSIINNPEVRFGDGGAPTLGSGNYSPSDDDEDCTVYVSGEAIDLTLNYLSFGRYYSDWGFGSKITPMSTGIVFSLAGAVPAAATITSAYIRFTAAYTNYSSVIRTVISGEEAAIPGAFSDYADFRDRARTTTQVTWDFSTPWITDSTYDTPDLSAVIQEIIADSWGGVARDYLTLFVEDDGSDYYAVRRPYAYDDPAGTAPTLYVTWSEPGAEASRHTGIRFRSLTIPLGATIRSASLRLYSTTAEATTANALIRYDTDTTPAAFSTYADFMARVRGSAHVHWSVTNWAINTWYTSDDITTLVQEYVNSWAGAAPTEMGIFIENNGSPAVMKRPASFDSGGHYPELNVTWTTGTTADYGRAATCNDEVYVVNKCNQAQLTHIYRRSAAGAWSANLCNTAAHTLFATAPVTDDEMIYFGVYTSASNVGPFCNLVFDIGVAATYTNDAYCFWEYYDAGWQPLTVSDETVAIGGNTYYGAAGGRPFGRTGVHSVVWEQPAGWETYTPAGIENAWWIRCRYDSGVVPGVMTQPTNITIPIYTTLWNNVSIAAAQVPGDIPVRGRIRAAAHIAPEMENGVISRMIIGARSNSRVTAGEFDSFVNLSDIQWGGNYSVSAGALGPFTGASGTINDAPTGRWIHATVTTLDEDIAATINFSSRAYEGTFHVYLRYIPEVTGTAGWPLRARLEQYFGRWSTDWAPLYNSGATTTARMYIADLGVMRLHGMTPLKPEVALASRVSDTPTLYLYLYNPTGSTSEVELIDLVFIPSDEWIGDIRAPFSTSGWDDMGGWPGGADQRMPIIGKYLDIDSARMPYYHTMSVLRNSARASGTNDTLIYTTSASEPVMFQCNTEQDLHFLSMIQADEDLGDSLWCSYPYPLFSIQLSGVSRYIIARGSR